MEASRELLGIRAQSQVPESPSNIPIVEQAEKLLNTIRDRDFMGDRFDVEGVSIRHYEDDYLGIKLNKIGGTILIVGRWEEDDFVNGRRIEKIEGQPAQRSDFDLEQAAPVLLQELGLTLSALKRYVPPKQVTRTLSSEIASRRTTPIINRGNKPSEILQNRSLGAKRPVWSDDDRRMAQKISRGPSRH